jgi:PadR family transcriptional regulator PadR
MQTKSDLLPGTLEMLILLTLRREPLHGYAIAQHIQQSSADLLRVEEGSLYPALQRMLIEGWIKAEWCMSAKNRRVRRYTITAAGRKQLGREKERVGRAIDGLVRVMKRSEA